MPACILDACALIAFLRAEPGGEKLRELLASSQDAVLIHGVNALRVGGE
jgi:PIN domain nuclease of toxin-antitoxin system